MNPEAKPTGPKSGDAARSLIMKVVAEKPGVHKSELCRQVGLGWGTVSYHLRLLEKTRRLQTVTGTREVRVFPGNVPEARTKALAALQGESGHAVADMLADRPGSRQSDICRALGASRKLIRRHLEALQREGLVTAEGNRRARYLPTPMLTDLLKSEDEAAPTGTHPVGPGF